MPDMNVGSSQPDITSMPRDWRSVCQYLWENPVVRRYGEMVLLMVVGAWPILRIFISRSWKVAKGCMPALPEKWGGGKNFSI